MHDEGQAANSESKRRTLIRGGRVVNASGSRDGDVLIEGSTIMEIGENLTAAARGARVIDARGLLVFPGGIDPHVHLTPPFVDDFETGSRAALAGGITTVGVMTFPDDGEGVAAMLARHAAQVARSAMVDVMLHPSLGARPRLEDLPVIAAAGHTSFKIFTMEGEFDKDFQHCVAALERAKALGVLPLFHCEDQAVLKSVQEKLKAQGLKSLRHYEASRPVLAEVLAVQKVIALCELTGCPVYIVHLSSSRALRMCEEARARGVPVHVETRPIYLHLTAEQYQEPDGALYVGMPPIHSREDGEALWKGLESGSIETLGSDHAPWSKKEKLDPKYDIGDPPAGMSNLQVMLPMLYSEGVIKGRLSMERFVAVTSTNAARLFGLYPRKGVLQVGADADICLWDPAKEITIHAADGYTREDFSVYENWKVRGGPRMALRRGEVACRDGVIAARPGSGKMLLRKSGQSA